MRNINKGIFRLSMVIYCLIALVSFILMAVLWAGPQVGVDYGSPWGFGIALVGFIGPFLVKDNNHQNSWLDQGTWDKRPFKTAFMVLLNGFFVAGVSVWSILYISKDATLGLLACVLIAPWIGVLLVYGLVMLISSTISYVANGFK